MATQKREIWPWIGFSLASIAIIGITVLCLTQEQKREHEFKIKTDNTYQIEVGSFGLPRYAKEYTLTNGILSFVDVNGTFYQFENKKYTIKKYHYSK